MSLRRLRDLLSIASTGALALVSGEVDELSRRVAELVDEINARNSDLQAQLQRGADALRGEADVLRGQTDMLRAEIQALRGERDNLQDALTTLGARFDAHAERSFASADDLSDLRAQIEGHENQAEHMRLKLAAIGGQLRWESEDLRKSLAAIVERVERERKAG